MQSANASWPCNLMLSSLADKFTSNLPTQPKLRVGEYVRSQGILVPRTFSSLQAALDSGVPFIVRTESPYEYDGASGMGRSFLFDAYMIEEFRRDTGKNLSISSPAPAMAQYFRDSDQDNFERTLAKIFEKRITQLAGLAKLPSRAFIDSFSFSYWEYLPGINISVVADSAVSNRYHVFSSSVSSWNYAVIQDGEISIQGPMYTGGAHPQLYEHELIGDPKTLIAFYERVRTLPAFNRKNSAIVELQAVQPGEYAFLQYHRTRDFRPANFRIDGDKLLSLGYRKADFVRGATPENGVEFEVSLQPDAPGVSSDLGTYTASYVYRSESHSYKELMTRRVQALFIDLNFERIAFDSFGHLQRSQLFNPPITVLLPLIEVNRLNGTAQVTNRNTASARIHTVSDGLNAYYLITEIHERE